jgi:nitrogen fixation/metabolism regulation signal transduction histidine kinase
MATQSPASSDPAPSELPSVSMGDAIADTALGGTQDAQPSPMMRSLARRNTQMRWLLSLAAATMLAVASVLIFLLALATNNQTRFEQYYERLLYLNLGVAAVFLLVIAWVVWRLVSRVRRGKFGSRLLIKLAAIFALVGFVPGVLIYTVSYQFVSRSIESWFNVKVEGALDAGINLGRNTMDALSADLATKTRAAAQQLSENPSIGPLALERLREQLGAIDVIVWSAGGQVLGSAGQSRFTITPERPTTVQLRQVRTARVVSAVEGLEEAADRKAAQAKESDAAPSTVRVRAIALISSGWGGFGLGFGAGAGAGGSGLGGLSSNSGGSENVRFLQVTQVIPAALVANALTVQEAYQEYQQRALARDGLRNMYLATLTLSLFLAMFGAVLLAVLLGNQLVRPLLVLADGVAQVAAGDLRPKAALQTRDELGGLTRSFAQMTQQLFDARTQLQDSMGLLDASRANLQTILDNLTAAVIVLDAQGQIVQANPGATRVLQAPLAACIGQRLATVAGLEDFGLQVDEQFRVFFSDRGVHADHWQHSFELGAHGSSLSLSDADKATSIIARGAALPGQLRLLVLDDITEIVSAQRSRAWGEVARRLAHEIKNPLTPIQLSAERLEMKLQGKLQPPDHALLTRSVKTIVDQVDAMKRLVNEFRDYARLPSAELKPTDLNALIAEVMSLYAPENAMVPITSELDPACPMIPADAQQLRQVIHNLLQNAQDACLTAASGLLAEYGGKPAQVLIRTRFNPASNRVRLTVLDNGTGFAPHILQRAFEPYVSTKSRGTGLGLAVVKKIADEHGARIELSNRLEDIAADLQTETQTEKTLSPRAIGAQVSLSFPVV